MIIYSLNNPVTGCAEYIGQTCQEPRLRMDQHRYNAKRRGSKIRLYAWWKSLANQGLEPVMEVLEVATSREELNDIERFWISSLLSAGAQLRNLSEGGEGRGPGPFHSAETRQKISLGGKGIKKPGTSAANKGHKYQVGRKHSQEERIKRSRSLGGRPVVDSLGRRFETVAEMCRETGLQTRCVSKCLNGKARTHRGLTFKYAE